MKRWIADGLRSLANWLSPIQAESVSADTWREREYTQDATLQGLEARVVKLEKNVENLSLLAGFKRGIQTLGGRK